MCGVDRWGGWRPAGGRRQVKHLLRKRVDEEGSSNAKRARGPLATIYLRLFFAGGESNYKWRQPQPVLSKTPRNAIPRHPGNQTLHRHTHTHTPPSAHGVEATIPVRRIGSTCGGAVHIIYHSKTRAHYHHQHHHHQATHHTFTFLPQTQRTPTAVVSHGYTLPPPTYYTPRTAIPGRQAGRVRRRSAAKKIKSKREGAGEEPRNEKGYLVAASCVTHHSVAAGRVFGRASCLQGHQRACRARNLGGPGFGQF
jgi:hypothetical protein